MHLIFLEYIQASLFIRSVRFEPTHTLYFGISRLLEQCFLKYRQTFQRLSNKMYPKKGPFETLTQIENFTVSASNSLLREAANVSQCFQLPANFAKSDLKMPLKQVFCGE